jgi:preprotein translocase subunit SecB
LPEKIVDYAAVGRVAKLVELKNVRLSEIVAKSDPHGAGPLEAQLDIQCSVLSRENQVLEVVCSYKFAAHVAKTEIAAADIKYLVAYDMRGTEPVADHDLAEFATANGTVHSWPFAREVIFGLTSKMGYPPYTLPVVHFRAKPAEKAAEAAKPKAKRRNAPKPRVS